MIRISDPDIGPAEEAAVLAVLRSGNLAMGPLTAEFERRWAAYCGVSEAVMMSSGTVALEGLLHGLGIGPGDEVITVAFTFAATASAILRCGASPRFVDVGEDFCMNPALVEAAITPRTRAIMPVHLYGLMADMDPLVEIAGRHGLHIVEEAAQAHGASYHGRRAGQFGPAMFSLYATKNLAAGEGGVVTTDDPELADRLRLWRNHGMPVRYQHESLGTNAKPTDIAAALALGSLDRLDERLSRRRENAAFLGGLLGDWLVPTVPAGRDHAWHQFVMRFPEQRDLVQRHLANCVIGTGIYYPLGLHRQPFISEWSWHSWRHEAFLPVTDRLAGEVLALPVHPKVSRDDLLAIASAVWQVATPGLR